MKVVNNEGRFQFVKNQIVEIDPKLPKYQKLKIQRAVEAEEYKRIHGTNTKVQPRTNSSDGSYYGEIEDNHAPIGLQSLSDTDLELRKLIIKMKEENTLRKYLNSKDAEKLNSEFINVLIGEQSRNEYDLNIPESRWLFENPHPITETEEWFTNPGNSPRITLCQDAYDYYTFDGKKVKNNLINRIISYFKNTTKDASKAAKEKIKAVNGLSVLDLFDILHVKKGHEADLIKRLEGYYQMLEDAESNGQTALFDELAQKIFINVYESVSAVHGYNKYVYFSELEELQKKWTRVLDIDYISSFGRVIPANVCKKKKDCDKLCVFDNYCVLYYDPDVKAKTTKKEAKAKRDPILFGMINHSDKLYYIDSWVDELCDLTIETIADKLGKEAVKELK